MSKEIKNIDDLFRSTLGNHKVKAPLHVKKNVSAHIGPKNILFSISIAIISIAAIGSLLYWNYSPKNELYTQREQVIHLITPETQHNVETHNYTAAIISQKEELSQTPESRHSQSTDVASVNTTKLIHDQNASESKSTNAVTSSRTKTKKPNFKIKDKSTVQKQSNNKSIVLKTEEIKTVKTQTVPTEKNEITVNTEKEIDLTNTGNLEKNKQKSDDHNLVTNQSHALSKQALGNKNISNTDQAEKNKSAIDQDDDEKLTTNQIHNNSIENDQDQTQLKNDDTNIILAEKPIIEKEEKTKQVSVDNTTIENPNISDSIQKRANTPIDEKIDDAVEMMDTAILNEPIVDVKPPRKGYWMTTLEGGLKLNKAKYNGTNTEFIDFLTKNNNEKTGFYTQLNATYTLNNGFFGGLGLGYEEQSYGTSYWTSHLEINSIDTTTTTEIIITDTLNIIDTTFITKVNIDTTYTDKIQSEFGKTTANYLQIPIHFGYQFERNRWIFGLSADFQINYLLNKTGTYYVNNKIIDLSDPEVTVFEKTTILYNFGVTVHYNIARNIYVTGKLSYAPSSQNYYNTSYGSRTLSGMKMGLGLSLKF